MAKNILDLAPRWDALKPHLNESFQGVVVACSGGVDSTVLFRLLAALAETQKNFRLAVTHVAYGLRGAESEEDFRFVEDLAGRFGVPFIPRHVSPQERAAQNGSGIQAWARRVRQAHFRRLGAAGWVVALAHHQDDLAETALFRLARGSSPGKLLGMREWTPPLWRPFLTIPKAALVDFAVQEQIPYREDSSNAKLDYARNVIRHQVLPLLSQLFPGAPFRIVACAEEAAALSSRILTIPTLTDATVSPMLPCHTLAAHPLPIATPVASGWSVPLRTLLPLQQEEARAILARVVQSSAAEPRQLSRRWLDAVLAGARQKARHPCVLAQVPGGGTVQVDAQGCVFFAARSQDAEQKTPRREQHVRALQGPDTAFLLEAGSQVFLTKDMASSVIVAHRKVADVPTLFPICFKVYGGAAATTFAFQGQKKTWMWKELLAAWRIPMSDRGRWRLLEADGAPLGITDGRYVVRPDLKGATIRDDQTIVNFQTTDVSNACAEGAAHA